MNNKIKYILQHQSVEQIGVAFINDLGEKPFDVSVEQICEYFYSISSKHFQWLVNQYIKGNFKYEDLEGIKSSLLLVDKLVRNKTISIDISHLSLYELYGILRPYEQTDVVSNKEADRQYKQSLFDNKEATLFFKSDELTIVIPHTINASQYFGKSTKWCTAAKKNNQFENYNKKGPLYIIMSKISKFQFHPNTLEFTNELNASINLSFLFILLNKHTHLIKDIFGVSHNTIYKKNNLDVIGLLMMTQQLSEKVIMRYVTKYGLALQFVKKQTPEICMAAVKQYGLALQYVMKQTPEICMAAVEQNGDALQYVTNMTLELYKELMC